MTQSPLKIIERAKCSEKVGNKFSGPKPNQFPRSNRWPRRLTLRKFKVGLIGVYHEKTAPS